MSNVSTICTIVILGIIALSSIIGLIVAFCRGEMKKFMKRK